MAAPEAVLALKLVGIERTLAFLAQALLTLSGSQKDKDLSVLEGLLAKHLAQRYPTWKVLALDGSAEAIEHGKAEFFAVPPNLTLQVADWNEFSAPVGSFDIILFTRSLHHISPMPKAVEKAHQLLKSDGIIAMQEFARERMDADTASWLWDRLELLEATGVWKNARNKRNHSFPSVSGGANATKCESIEKLEEAHGHGHAHSSEQKNEHSHGHAHSHGEHGRSHGEQKKDEPSHGHSHGEHKQKEVKNDERHAHSHSHGHSHWHSHEGGSAVDWANWPRVAREDPLKLWENMHWHPVPLSTGIEMIAEITRVFGTVHYQEPRTPYLYFYAEHGMRTHAEQSEKPHSIETYMNASRVMLEQELARMVARPEGSVGLNFAAQKK